MPKWTRTNFAEIHDVSPPDVICIGDRKPEGPDSARFPDFWA